MFDIAILIALTVVVVIFIGIYLRGLLTIKTPMGLKSKIFAGLSWLFFSIFIFALFLVGVRMITSGTFGLHRIWAISPIGIGFVISLYVDKKIWIKFNKQFANTK